MIQQRDTALIYKRTPGTITRALGILLLVGLGIPALPRKARPLQSKVPQSPTAETAGNWQKYIGNPVLGGSYGTCFDISVLRERGKYRMWFSWRPKKSVAVVESADGIHWSEPQIVLGPDRSTGWEDDINRPVVIKHGNHYEMWYTGQANGKSAIGYATSRDGITWKRMSAQPVLSAEGGWEKSAVMCPDVIWDGAANQYRMWYSGGEQGEPNAIGYAVSSDGIHWRKHQDNPVFTGDPKLEWEHNRVTACMVAPVDGWMVMFYIGFRDVDHAQIGIARSRDGISNWQRCPDNPIIRPGFEKWDHDACYKPYAIYDGKQWLLWYNVERIRHGGMEQIGLAVHPGKDLGFSK